MQNNLLILTAQAPSQTPDKALRWAPNPGEVQPGADFASLLAAERNSAPVQPERDFQSTQAARPSRPSRIVERRESESRPRVNDNNEKPAAQAEAGAQSTPPACALNASAAQQPADSSTEQSQADRSPATVEAVTDSSTGSQGQVQVQNQASSQKPAAQGPEGSNAQSAAEGMLASLTATADLPGAAAQSASKPGGEAPAADQGQVAVGLQTDPKAGIPAAVQAQSTAQFNGQTAAAQGNNPFSGQLQAALKPVTTEAAPAMQPATPVAGTGQNPQALQSLTAGNPTPVPATSAAVTAGKPGAPASQAEEASSSPDGLRSVPESASFPGVLLTTGLKTAGETSPLPEPARLAEARTPVLARQVSLGIEGLVKSGQSSLQVQLQPKDLGRIDLKLTTTGDGTWVTITTERPLTGSLLERHINELKQSLEQAGVHLNGLSFQSHDQSQGHHAQNDRGLPARQAPDLTRETDVDETAEPIQWVNVGSTSNVDYHI